MTLNTRYKRTCLNPKHQIYKEMIDSGLKPDSTTFNAVLSAHCAAGLWHEVFFFSPTSSHTQSPVSGSALLHMRARRMNAPARTHTQTYECAQTHTHARTRARAHTHTQIKANVINVLKLLYACTLDRSSTHACTHTRSLSRV